MIVLAHPVPTRGALRDRHEWRARDAMDVSASTDEWCRCGRRSRVVLVPRRWDQPSGLKRCRPCSRHAESPGGTVAKKPGTPRRSRISR